MSYRDDIAALTARHDALAHDLAGKTRELDEARQLLDEAKRRARLPILDNIRVATPCKADWNAMTGDERVRHCGACKKDVFNISQLTRADAEALIRERNGGELCVRYFQRSDGTILLADCTVGRKRRRKLTLIAAGAAALLAGGVAAGALLARGAHHTLAPDDDDSGHYIQGGIGPSPYVAEVAPEQPPAPQPQGDVAHFDEEALRATARR